MYAMSDAIVNICIITYIYVDLSKVILYIYISS